MDDTTLRYKMPYLAPSQAQKHVTHNEALRLLDFMLNLRIIDIDVTAPSGTEVEGSCVLVSANPSGAFIDHANEIAAFIDGSWEFAKPFEGLTAYFANFMVMKVFDGEKWIDISSNSSTSSNLWGVNTQPDQINRLAVKSDAVLLSHDDQTPGDGNSRVVINKSSDTSVSAIQFSTNYSTSAELGLIGNNNLAVRMSPDGTNFSTALELDYQSGNFAFGSSPTSDKVSVREDQAGSTRFSVSNYNTENPANSSIRLNASNNHYFAFQLYGTGTIYAYSNARFILGTYANEYLSLRTDTTDRMFVHGDGRITINQFTPSAQLSVNGAIRVGQFSKTSLPNATVNGAGALIFVYDATGGAVLAFSDGSQWRRSTDRTIVN